MAETHTNGYLMLAITELIEGQKATHDKLDKVIETMIYKADCDACKAQQEEKYVNKALFTTVAWILGVLTSLVLAMTSVIVLVLKGADLVRLLGWA